MYYNNDNSSDPTWRDFTSGGEGSSSSSNSSSSYSGLPDWFKNMKGWGNGNYDLSGLWNNSIKYGMIDAYKNVLNPKNDPNTSALIESQRRLMPEQYRQQMELSNARGVQQPLNTMSSRGILNSSVTGDALAKVLREQSARQADQYTQANTWAGNELLKNLASQQSIGLDTWKSTMNFLPQLLASLRESISQSQGQSNSEYSSWGAPGWPGTE
jgi:hypothetical protein